MNHSSMSATNHARHTAADSVEKRIRQRLQTIRACDGQVHAFVDCDEESALEQAKTQDRLLPDARGKLHGLGVAVKEIFDVRGLRCSYGSPLFSERVADTDAAIVTSLRRAGAVVLGTTVSTEFAIAEAGPTRNPHDLSRTPGGSSSGSAAAVATGMAEVAIGSQTIGSIIRPAAYCGVIGFKPSYDLIPIGSGMLTLSPPLDHVGVIGADITRIRRTVAALSGQSLCDEQPLGGVCRLNAWFDDPLSAPVMGALNTAFAALEQSGGSGRTLSLPESVRIEADATNTLLRYDMARYLGAMVKHGETSLSAGLREMLRKGKALNETTYVRALQIKNELTKRLHEILRPGEIFLAPSTLDVAPALSEGTGPLAPQRLWTLCGMPTLNIPAGKHGNLPLGVQLIGRQGEDALLLNAGEILMARLP